MTIRTFKHHPEDTRFLDRVFSGLPLGMLPAIQRRYMRMCNHAGRKEANTYLLRLDAIRKSGLFATLLPEHCTLKLRAEAAVERAVVLIDQYGVPSARSIMESDYQLNDLLGHVDTLSGIAARLTCSNFWLRQFSRQSDQQAERVAIAAGIVRVGIEPYLSTALFRHIRYKQQRQQKMLAGLEAVNKDTGETVDMSVVLKGSMSNPELRRIEMMTRCKGFEDYAQMHQHVSMFYTLTAPSQYHSTRTQKLQAFDNIRYAGHTPKDAQRYLCGLWGRIRAKLKRQGLNIYGFRVAEPHKDGCPHWHLLLFMPEEQRIAITQIIRHYALKADTRDLFDVKGNISGNAYRARFDAKVIDLNQGSATGYIAKYISKNLDGYGISESAECGVIEDVSRVRAWASLWGIRQFQQIGGPPVGVWRELRRISQPIDDDALEDVRCAADGGDWLGYMQLQGGNINRAKMPLRVVTTEVIDTATGEVLVNRYGEVIRRIKGVGFIQGNAVTTREHEWCIQSKVLEDDKHDIGNSVRGNIRQNGHHQLLVNDFVTPWTSVNNCTHECFL